MKKSELLIVTAYSNFRRSKYRPALTKKWLKETQEWGAKVCLSEFALGDRPFEFNPEEWPHVHFVQLRGDWRYEMWLRDAQIMAAVERFPNYKYYVWEDADITHLNNDWVMDTMHMLQHNRVGQTWTHSYDLDINGNIARNEWGNDVDRSFCAAWLAGEIELADGPYKPPFPKCLLEKKPQKDWRAHTGYSWAMRHDTLFSVKLIDFLITGSSDWHMALGFCGKLKQVVFNSIEDKKDFVSNGYYDKLLNYADKCIKFIKQDIGVVDGTVAHGWHGSKKHRFYGTRESIFIESHYDPNIDIAHDGHNMPYLCSDNIILREGLRRLVKGVRKWEDSIDG